MIKFLIAFAPPPALPRQACLAHYRDKHGALVASVPEFRREVRAYLQNEVILGAPCDAPSPAIAGVSELWFDDWQRYQEAFSGARYLAEIRPDEERFADLATVLVAFAEDRALFGGEGVPRYKLFGFWEPQEELKAAEFEQRWADYGAALTADEGVRAHATAYVQNHAVPPEENPFPFGHVFAGIDEFWLDRVQDVDIVAARQMHHALRAGLVTASSAGLLRFATEVRAMPGFGNPVPPGANGPDPRKG